MRSADAFGEVGRVAIAVLVGATALLCASPAWAVKKAACIAAHEEGQKLRTAAKLGAARDKFKICGDPSCPDIVRADCVTWTAETTKLQPSVLIVATGRDGKEILDVKVSLDGKEIATSLDGRAIPVDPGAHKLTFRIAGEPERTADVVLKEGDRDRKVEITWGAAAPPKPPPVAPPEEPTKPPPTVPEEPADGGGGGIHPAAWILGGVGVVGGGLFATFAALGSSEYSSAETECMPGCSDDVVDSIRTKYLVGDISLAVGVGAMSAAIVVLVVSLTSGDDAAGPEVTLRASPAIGGGFATLEARF